MLSFTNFCPFSVMRLRNLPGPQRYTRQERYRARPPRVLERSGFHNENSLAIYQGLIYYLLWLHSVYDKVGVRRRAGRPETGLGERGAGLDGEACGAERSGIVELEDWGVGWVGDVGAGPGLSRTSRGGCWRCGWVESRVWGCAGVCIFCSGLGAGIEAGRGSGDAAFLGALAPPPNPFTVPGDPCSRTRTRCTTPPGAGGRKTNKTR